MHNWLGLMEYGYSAISKVTVTGNKLVIIKEYLRTSYVDIHDHIQNRFVSWKECNEGR